VSPSLRRALFTGGAIVFFVALAGATYQGVATALERRQFPHPGRLVDVGGHQLHIYCEGNGAPTVVLEAPATAMSSAWAWVQADVAKITRVCSYDRAGLGWSEAGDAPFTPEAVPTELNALLHGAEEHAPYLLAGAELGAAYASLYASRYQADTVALVLVDPPDPFGSNPRSTAATRFLMVSPWLARTGVLRATRTLTNSAAGLPQPAAGALKAFLNRPDHLTRAARELSRWGDTVAMADAAPQRQTLPATQVVLEGSDRVALLADRKDAQDVAMAISRAVAVWRARQPR
jgi:pimeloyl-ACP methyl ester carboxylesterase